MAKKRTEANGYAEMGRVAVQKIVAYHDLPVTTWCRQAGLKNANAVHNYLARLSDSLNTNTTLLPLAKAVGLTASHLLGEIPLPWEASGENGGAAGLPKSNKPVQVSVKAEDLELNISVNADHNRIIEMVHAIIYGGERAGQ